MNQRILTAFLALPLVFGRPAIAQNSNTAARPDLKSFSIIADRNIFDPDRRAGRPSIGPVGPRRRVESFTLVGTMSYEKGVFAFLDGSDSYYRKTVKPQDMYAGYKVASITRDSIQLSASTNKPVDMRVGMQMRRENGGPWSMFAQAETSSYGRSSRSESSSSSPVVAPPSLPAQGSGAENDVIRRLMLKRAQESK